MMDTEKSIRKLKTYYSAYPGDNSALKERIVKSVSDTSRSHSDGPRFRMSKGLLFGIPSALLLMGAGIAYRSTTMTQPHALTKQQIEKLNNQTSEIVTHYGNFARVDKPISLPNDEIVHKLSKITAQTREIILPYGVFVKK